MSLLGLILLTSTHTLGQSSTSQSYTIEYISQLTLHGTTNINEFSCGASEDRAVRTVVLHEGEQSECVSLEAPELKVYVPSLDCGRKGMNQDLRETLEAETYPYIRIDIQQAELKGLGNWNIGETRTGIQIHTAISITDKTRSLVIPMRATRTAADSFSFEGQTSLRLTDFGIQPPEALLGLIQVNDQLTVNFTIHAKAR